MLSSDINVKTWPLSRSVGLVCAGGGGGGQSRRYYHPNFYHDPTIIYSISLVLAGGVGQWLQMHFTLTTRVGTCVRLITMEMSADAK